MGPALDHSVKFVATMPFTEQFDVVVVGAGHAECEIEAFCGRDSERSEEASPQPKSRAQRGTLPS